MTFSEYILYALFLSFNPPYQKIFYFPVKNQDYQNGGESQNDLPLHRQNHGLDREIREDQRSQKCGGQIRPPHFWER